jgi:hypothetical protein
MPEPLEQSEAEPEVEHKTDAQQDKVGEKLFTDGDMKATRKSYEKKLLDAEKAHTSALTELQSKNASLEKIVRDAVINVMTANMPPAQKRLFDKLSLEEQLEEIQNEDFLKDLKANVKTPVTPTPATKETGSKQVPIGR